MTVFTKPAVDVFAPYDAAGNGRQIVPQEAQVWGAEVERWLTSYSAGGGIIFGTKSGMDLTLTYPENTMAWVLGDPAAANNGIYRKSGSSGFGSWIRLGDLPYSYVRLTDTGAGSENAIQLTSAIPTSSSVMRVANVIESNTGNVTISENGGAPKALLTSSGYQISPGGLTALSMIVYVDDGSNFRLLSDEASAAIVAAAEAARDLAKQYRDEALAAAAGVNLPPIQPGDAGKQLYVRDDDLGYELKEPSTGFVDDTAALALLNTSTTTEATTKDGGVWRFESGDLSALVSADGIGNFVAGDVATTSGAWVRRYEYKLQGLVDLLAGDCNGTSGSGTDNYAIFAKIVAVAKLRGGCEVFIPPARGGLHYRIGTNLLDLDGDDIQFVGSPGASKLFFDHAAVGLQLCATLYRNNIVLDGLELRNSASGGQIINFGAGLVKGQISRLYVRQANTAQPAIRAIHNVTASNTVFSTFRDLFVDCAPNHASSLINCSTSLGARFQANVWENITLHHRGSASAAPSFQINVTTGAAAGNRGNTLKGIWGESNTGGLLSLSGFSGEITGVTLYDLGSYTTHGDLITFASGGTNICEGITFSGYRRNNGTLGSGKHDLKLFPSVQNSLFSNFTVESTAASAASCDIGNQAVALINVQGAINTTNATVLV